MVLKIAMATPWKKLGEAAFWFGWDYFWDGGRGWNTLRAGLRVVTI